MKRILFFATVDMFGKTGGGIATLSFFNSLNQIYPGKVDLYHAEEYIPNHYFSHNNIITHKRITKLQWAINIVTCHFHRFYPNFINFLLENKDDYSILVVNGSRYIGDIIKLVKSTKIKIIIIHHNFEIEYIKANPNIANLWGLTNPIIKNQEKMAYKLSDINIFLTNDDLNSFKQCYGYTKSKCEVINIFEPKEIEQKIIPKGNADLKIIISGALDFEQTVQGIKDFYNNYYDIVNTIGDYPEIIITGRNPRQYIIDLSKRNSNILVISNPVNIADVIEKCNIYLCPINVGGGIKLRIKDGLKSGIPVLTHKCSSRGYEKLFNKPYFKVYHDAASFANGLKELIDYINSCSYSPYKIIDEYISIFGYKNGVKQLEQIMTKIEFYDEN